MPNTANINRLIERIKEDGGVHFAMSQWMNYLRNMPGLGNTDREFFKVAADHVNHYETCKTALCLGGWINLMLKTDAGAKPEQIEQLSSYAYTNQGASWLGISYADADSFFKLDHYSLVTFDRYPGYLRVDCAVLALEALRDGKENPWQVAFEAKGLMDGGYLMNSKAARDLYPDPDPLAPPSLMGDGQ